MFGRESSPPPEDLIARHDIEMHLRDCVTYREHSARKLDSIDGKQDQLQAQHYAQLEKTLMWRSELKETLNKLETRTLFQLVSVLGAILGAIILEIAKTKGIL